MDGVQVHLQVEVRVNRRFKGKGGTIEFAHDVGVFDTLEHVTTNVTI